MNKKMQLLWWHTAGYMNKRYKSTGTGEWWW